MICENLLRVQDQIRRAATNCGRNPEDIQLVAVSKKMEATAIAEALRCGQHCFGENYLQEALTKINRLEGPIQWHFIGHLQSNKAKNAARFFQVIETVDRLKIARALDKYAGEYNKTLEILVQVNMGRETQKSGVLPEKTEELLKNIKPLANLHVLGLMTTPPFGREPEASRPWFRGLRELSLQLAARELFADNQNVQLSMGMSGDFAVAIEEGTTIVRVGTAIFGSRL